MSYRKFKADNIFTGYKLLDSDHVLISDEEGKIIEITGTKEAGDDIETYSGILSPGFINTHCHLELSHLKGIIPKHTGLADFVLKVITGRHTEEEVILEAINQAEDEMIRNGIVAVGDICNNELTIPQKIKNRLSYHNFIEVSGFPPAVMKERFNRSAVILENYLKKLPASKSTLSPHAPYSTSTQLFEMISRNSRGQLLTMHNQETAEENKLFKEGSGDLLRLYKELGIDISFFKPGGKSSLQTVMPYIDDKQSVILVHNVHSSREDIEFAASLPLDITWCLCPNANLYINNELPDVDQFVAGECNIVLGTDSLASNHQLNIMQEVKTIQAYFPHIELATILQWATINGARTLGMEDLFGSFEKGKMPGVLVLQGRAQLYAGHSSEIKRLI